MGRRKGTKRASGEGGVFGMRGPWKKVQLPSDAFDQFGLVEVEVLDPKEMGEPATKRRKKSKNSKKKGSASSTEVVDLGAALEREEKEREEQAKQGARKGNEGQGGQQKKKKRKDNHAARRRKKLKLLRKKKEREERRLKGQGHEVEDPVAPQHRRKKETSVVMQQVAGEVDLSGMDRWSSFGLHPRTLQCLQDNFPGFVAPTPVQAQTLPASVRARKDVIAAAETGSGKTLAYALPIVNALVEDCCTGAAAMVGDGTEGREEWELPRKMVALVILPTRELAQQVTSVFEQLCKGTPICVASLFGGMSSQKQERVMAKRAPPIVVATPGRFWQLAEEGCEHVASMSSLRFLVIDEADRMASEGHFPELQSILAQVYAATEGRIDMSRMDVEEMAHAQQLGAEKEDTEEEEDSEEGEEEYDATELMRRVHERFSGAVSAAAAAAAAACSSSEESSLPAMRLMRRHLQTFLLSATLTLPSHLREKRGKKKQRTKFRAPSDTPDNRSLERLMEMLHFQDHPKIVNLTSEEHMTAQSLKEAKIRCLTEDKDVYAYYFCWSYPGRTLVFTNSIDSAKRLTRLLSMLQVRCFCIHSRMEQRQRLKNMDRFRSEEASVLVATDVAARGLDVPQVQYVIHYNLPRSVETYVHRSGRTARASRQGLSLSLLGPEDVPTYNHFCRSLGHLGRKGLPDFPVERRVLKGLKERIQLARKVYVCANRWDKKTREENWTKKNAKEIGLDYSSSDEEEHHASRKNHERELLQAQAELEASLKRDVLPRGYSRSFVSTNLARFGTLTPSACMQGRDALSDLRQAVDQGVSNPVGADLQGMRFGEERGDAAAPASSSSSTSSSQENG